MKPTIPVTLACLLGVATQPALGGEDAPGRACVTLDNPQQRLACYDAAFGRKGPAAPAAGTATMTGSRDAETVAPAGKAAGDAPLAAPADNGADEASRASRDFGLNSTQLQQRRAADTPRAVQHIVARVTQVAKRPFGELILTLDNGQVWVQNQVERMARVKVGDTVTIRKAALGSYLLITAQDVATRVHRVQ